MTDELPIPPSSFGIPAFLNTANASRRAGLADFKVFSIAANSPPRNFQPQSFIFTLQC